MTVSVDKVESLEKNLKQIGKVQRWLSNHNFLEADGDEYELPDEYERLRDKVGFTRQIPKAPSLSDYKFFIQNWGTISEFLTDKTEEIDDKSERLKKAINSVDNFMEPIRVAEEL